MKKLRILFFLWFLTAPLLTMCQDVEADGETETVAEGFILPTPTAGKALIIFTRPALEAPITKFKYFCNDQYLGKIGTGSYLVYECAPGRYLFWADSESTRLLKAEVAADKVYIVDTFVQSGGLRPILTLKPFDPEAKRADRMRQRLVARISKREEQRFDPGHTEQPSKRLQREARQIVKQNSVDPVKGDGKGWSDVRIMDASQHL